jgi:hypothetical protein
MPRDATLHAAPLPAAAFLVDAASGPRVAGRWGEGRAGALVGLFAQLKARDRGLTSMGVPGE